MNKKILTISLIVLVLILGVAYFLLNNQAKEIVNQEQEEIINNEVDISDWETYVHSVYNFSFIHPKDIKVAVEFGKDQNKANEFYLGESYLAILSKESSVTLNDFINSKIMRDNYDVLYSFDNKLIIEPKIDQSVSFLVEDGTYLHTTLYAHSQMAFVDLGDYYLWFTSKIGSSGDGDLSIQDVEIVKSMHSIVDTSDWKTYRNEELGIEFKYPGDWELEDNQNYEFHSIYLSSPETKKLVENKQISYFYNIAIVYYPSILDEEENINSNNVEDLIAKNKLLTKIGNIKIGNKDAVDAVWGGHGASYVILAMEDLQLYKVVVPRISDRNDLNSTEKTIINSFVF